jgi:beta-galactosidase GanA
MPPLETIPTIRVGARPDHFVYGAAFHRPPDPPRTDRRRMLEDIASVHGFTIVRIYTSWGYTNPARGVYDFAEVTEILEHCAELGLTVLMGVNAEDSPFWLEAEFPHTRYVNGGGRPFILGGGGNNVSAGSPGLCFDWPEVREASAAYLRAMAAAVSPYDSLLAYDAWNEPQMEPSKYQLFKTHPETRELHCYCPRSIVRFQEWVRGRYGTLEALGEAWSRRYADWSHIDPPRILGTYADWIDWGRFLIDRTAEEMRFRVQQVRTVDPDTLIESHLGSAQVAFDDALTVLGVNPWRLAEEVETWGVTYFPRMFIDPVHRGFARLEITRSQAHGKPFWLSELQGGGASISGLVQAPQMRPRDIRLWNWAAVAAGARGIVYWCYRPATRTIESGDFALTAPDGSPTERVEEAALSHRRIAEHWDVIADYRPAPQVALLYDQDSSLLSFAMNGNEQMGIQSFRGYYQAIWESDLMADVLEPADVRTAPHRVLIAPWTVMVTPQLADDLRSYVEGGGTLIVQAGFAMHGDHGQLSPVAPTAGLAEVFGYRQQERISLGMRDVRGTIAESDRGLADAVLAFVEPLAADVRPVDFITPVTVGAGEVIGRYGDLPVATRITLGKGRVYFLGTNLGAAVDAGDEGALALVRAIIGERVTSAVAGDRLRPRLIEGAERSLLVVVNESTEARTEEIRAPEHYRSAVDIYSDETREVIAGMLSASVDGESVSVYRLT